MDGCSSEKNNNTLVKKRAREDDDSPELDSESPELKRLNGSTESDRVHSPVSEICQLESEESEDGDGEELASPEVVKFRKDILDILDEPEVLPEAQDLDSVIRSFEEEILQLSPSLPHRPEFEPPASYPGESQPDLGYLLEASDDELGLPPTVTVPVAGEQTQNEPVNLTNGNEVVVDGLGDMVELPTYDSFEFGIGDGVTEGDNFAGNGNGDFVAVDGLFDYADGSDFSEFAWRPESLPAL